MANNEDLTTLNSISVTRSSSNHQPKVRKRNSKKLNESATTLEIEAYNEEVGKKPSQIKKIVQPGRIHRKYKEIAPNIDNISNRKTQRKTDGSGAILGAVGGIMLGVTVGIATGVLAPFAIPVLAIFGYLGGIYVGDKIEASMLGLEKKKFIARIKGFIREKINRRDRTPAGTAGLIVGVALSLLTGPAFLLVLPFAAFFGNKIGAKLGQDIDPKLSAAISKVMILYREFFLTLKSKMKNRLNEIHNKVTNLASLKQEELQEFIAKKFGKSSGVNKINRGIYKVLNNQNLEGKLTKLYQEVLKTTNKMQEYFGKIKPSAKATIGKLSSLNTSKSPNLLNKNKDKPKI